MEKKDEEKNLRLEALNILNKHFRFQGKSGLLYDYQVKLVIDAMIEFQMRYENGKETNHK